ncbi:glucose 1-dehydrogenase [Sulfurisoma sediminicola]|uniref:Gluconate 5-dehydrogenase n=1 Tax=Sulfurisoma sediminicola TaxID=1381557 RepID=A0A497XDP1_9PROT|nr:glucose 1-dehydrogenase [Sulfurisoma sediminicola]RLJ65091.1 gluconate 5-dehydrogenase [Sulfurisoma sediminicola]
MNVRQMFDLTGKVALITGGSRGLGLQIAEGLAEMGAKSALAARRQDALDAAAARVGAAGGEVLTVAADLTAGTAPAAIVDAVLARYGRIDILVNNAATSWGAPAERHPLEAWRKVMALNLDALFALTQEVAWRAMIPQRSGAILNIASIAAQGGNPPEMEFCTAAYNASKAAAANLTQSLATEWGRHGIRVNALAPGFFATRMSHGLLDTIGARVVAATPLGRLGGDDDLKGAAVFLCSDAARHVTGQCLAVDGGMSCSY